MNRGHSYGGYWYKYNPNTGFVKQNTDVWTGATSARPSTVGGAPFWATGTPLRFAPWLTTNILIPLQTGSEPR